MFHGLVKLGKEISDSIHKFVALAPCTYSGDLAPGTQESLSFFDLIEYKVQNLGIYAYYNTPTWDKDLKTICDNLDPEFCESLRINTQYGAQTIST